MKWSSWRIPSPAPRTGVEAAYTSHRRHKGAVWNSFTGGGGAVTGVLGLVAAGAYTQVLAIDASALCSRPPINMTSTRRASNLGPMAFLVSVGISLAAAKTVGHRT